MRRMLGRAAGRLRGQGGQTFILVMTVTAMATVLGVMAMASALMSLRLRSMKRMADKNFYRLELAVEEVRSGFASDVAETALAAGEGGDWQGLLLDRHVGIHDLSVLDPDSTVTMESRRESARRDAASYLMGFSATIPAATGRRAEDRTEELSVEVGDVFLEEGAVRFREVRFTLINYGRDAQTSIVCDLIVSGPEAPRVDEVVRIAGWRRIG